MNSEKKTKRIGYTVSTLIAVCWITAMLAPNVMASNTVSVEMSLSSTEPYNPDNYYEMALNGQKITANGDISPSEATVDLTKGSSYSMAITCKWSGYVDPENFGYTAELSSSNIVVDSNYESDGEYYFSGYTEGYTATVYVPLFSVEGVTGSIQTSADAYEPGVTNQYVVVSNSVTISLACAPFDLSSLGLVTWEGAGIGDELTRVVTFDESNLGGGLITATFAGETIFAGHFGNPYGLGGTNPDMEGLSKFIKEWQVTREPIDTRTGNNHFTEKRLFAPCPGIPLNLDLTYQSVTDLSPGMLGKGWCHSYEWSLDTSGTVPVLWTGTGDKFTFGQLTNNTYISPLVNNWTLEEDNNEFDVTLPGGLVYHFNTNGQLSTIIDAWNNRIDCSYGTNGCLEAAEHSNGREIVFSNSWHSTVGAWRVASVKMTDGASLDFVYDSGGQFTQIVEQVDSSVFTSTYDYSGGYLTNKVNGAGFEYKFEYESGSGKGTRLSVDGYYDHEVDYVDADTTDVTYHSTAMDQIYRYSYGQNGTLDTHYGPASSLANVSQRGISYTYGPNGNDMMEETRFDNTENATWSVWKRYDHNHNVTNLSVGYCTTNRIQQLSTEYDSVWQLPTVVTDAEGAKVETEYTNGLPRNVKQFYSDTQSFDTGFAYTTNGLLKSTTNANEHVVTFDYDGSGNLVKTIPAAGPSVTNTYDALGFVQTTEVLSESGTSSGRVMQYLNDEKGRVLQTTYPDSLTSSYEYNALGYLTNSVDRAGRSTDYTYAPTRQLTSVTRYLEQGGSNIPVCISYELDEQLNQLCIKEPRGRYVESYDLDIEYRVTAVTNIENQVMSLDYSVGDFLKSIARFDGSVISNIYDTAGRKTSEVYNPDAANALTLNYDYYADSMLKDISDATTTNSYAYDRLNRLTNSTFKVSGSQSQVSHKYDPVGSITNTVVSVEGTQTTATAYKYDNAERLSEISSQGGADTQKFVYAYSSVNGLVESVSNTVSGITCTYGYDIMDRVTNIAYRTSNGSLIQSLEYAYNAASMITNKAMAGGTASVSSYGYDSLDQLTGETRTVGGLSSVSSYTYDLAGNRLSKSRNGIDVSYTLGTGNRLGSWSAAITNGFTAEISGTSTETIGTGDRWGQLWVSNRTASGNSGSVPSINGTGFSSDNVSFHAGTNQVIAAIRDSAGNMGYATNTVVYSVVTNAAFLYNAAGCVTNIAHTGTGGYSDNLALEWDERYRLTGANNGTTSITYGYDVLGRKVSRAVGGNMEYYIYDGNQVVADVDENGDLLRSYVWGIGIDNLLCFTDHATSNTYYAIKDHQNTVLALVDENGDIVESYEYDAYGRTKVSSASGSELTASAYGNRYCFQGREIDWITGLYYFRARWYLPETGRWLSKDPIGIAGGLNLYEFCGNNPVNYADPLGLVRRLPGPPLSVGTARFDSDRGNVTVEVREIAYTTNDRNYNFSAYEGIVNCHGQHLTNGRVAINREHIRAILSGDSYQQTSGPVDGAWMIFSRENEIRHSGTIRLIDGEWYLEHRMNNGPVITEPLKKALKGIVEETGVDRMVAYAKSE